jgi:transposase-like protein
MRAYPLDLREKIVESVKKGVSKSETARRFGVDRAAVKRYCKQLDERDTLEGVLQSVDRPEKSLRKVSEQGFRTQSDVRSQ